MSTWRVVIDYGTRRGEPLSPFLGHFSDVGLRHFLADLFGTPDGLDDGHTHVTHVEVRRLRGTDTPPTDDPQVLFR